MALRHARIAACGRRRRTPPEVLHDHHRDDEVGERDEPRADRPSGTEAGAAPVEGLVVLGGPELPDDEQDDDRELGEPVERGGATHEVVGVVGALEDVAEVAGWKSWTTEMRLASAAPSTPAAQSITPNTTTSDDGQAPEVAPPGRAARPGPCGRGWRRRKRCRRQAGGGSGGRPGGGGGGGSCVTARIVSAWIASAWGGLDAPLCQTRHHGAREAELEAPLLRGGHVGAVHRVRRMRDRVPARRARLPRHRGRLQAVPARGGVGPRELQPRREELHVVHPGLPAVPRLGARDRRVHVRARRAPTRSRRASTRTSCWRAPPTRSSPRWARTAGWSRRSSCTRSSTT